jgi:hypothetical protein
MTTDSMGQLVNQTMGSNPNDRAIQANSPESGFISRFFHTSALTVGMTKNGAMTMSRSTFSPNTGWSISKATRRPPQTLMTRTDTTRINVLRREAMKSGSVTKAT